MEYLALKGYLDRLIKIGDVRLKINKRAYLTEVDEAGNHNGCELGQHQGVTLAYKVTEGF